MNAYFFNNREELTDFIFNKVKDMREFFDVGLRTDIKFCMQFPDCIRNKEIEIPARMQQTEKEINRFCETYFFPCVILTECTDCSGGSTYFKAEVITKKEYYTRLYNQTKAELQECKQKLAEYEKLMNET